MEIYRQPLSDKNAVISARASDCDAVIVRCNGKRRADAVLRVVTLAPGTPYTRITASNVLEHLDSMPDGGNGNLQECFTLVKCLVEEYAKEHDDD